MRCKIYLSMSWAVHGMTVRQHFTADSGIFVDFTLMGIRAQIVDAPWNRYKNDALHPQFTVRH